MRRARMQSGSAELPNATSAREFLMEEVPFGGAKTLAYMSFAAAAAFDLMPDGRWEEAEDAVAKLLVAAEQAAHDNSTFTLAWPLTHLPEPPWHRLQRGGRPEDRPFGRLADPVWVAAAIAYMRDVAALQELRKKQGRDRGGGKAPPEKDA